MVLGRRLALAGALLALAMPALAGCGGSRPNGAQQASSAPSASSASPASLSPQSSTPASSSPATSSSATSATNLCQGADIAQNTADAYMGALSAGNLWQAMACVLPHTVPEALTRSLLAKAARTAVYLPRDGVDGPAVFGYQGNGKLIDVTVTKQPDGQFLVTRVAVRSG